MLKRIYNNYIYSKIFIIILFIIINVFIINTTCSADQFIVNKIYFKGLKRITKNMILFNIPITLGHNITNIDIRNIIKLLFATGNFDNIKVFRKENSLIIDVKERPVIANITFIGNKIINNTILNHFLQNQGIQVGKVLNPAAIFHIKRNIKDFYYNNGKYCANVHLIVTPLPYNRVTLALILHEGITAKIKQISIIGNHNFSTNRLKSNFKLQDKISWWNISKNQKYQKQKLDNDLESLRDFYLNHGYANFNINSTQINLTSDKSNVNIVIHITEGTKDTISNIIINGNISTTQYVQIKKITRNILGKLYNNNMVIKIEEAIKVLLNKDGYPYPYITTRLMVNNINKTVTIEINIDIGKHIYVRNIYFKGNKFTKDIVLRREMCQIEGSWLNNEFLEEGKVRLNRLGYFKKIDIEILPVLGLSDQVDVIYKVKERNTGSINIGIGFGSESGASIQSSIQQDNWFGSGNSIIVTGSKNNYQTYGELSIINPYFTINGINLNSKLFYNNFNADNADLSNYNLRSYGGNTSFGLPINERELLHIGFNYMHNDLTHMKPQISMWRYLKSVGKNLKIITKDKWNNNIKYHADDFFLSLGWQYNSLNQNYFPTSGTYTKILSKITTPGSDNEYYRIIFKASHYIPLTKQEKWVITGSTQIGFSDGLHGKEIPFYDNFYVGGFNTVRGFSTNTIGPKAVYYKCSDVDISYDDCKIEPSKDAIGGNAMIIASIELIMPTPLLSKQYTDSVRTLLFVDSGTVWDTHWHNTNNTYSIGIPNYKKANNIRVSTGVALQWLSPLGPMIFSYALPIKNYSGDQLERFQFTIGKVW